MSQGNDAGDAAPKCAPAAPDPEVSGDRREAMRRIGGYAAYVTPAMLALVSTRNHAGS